MTAATTLQDLQDQMAQWRASKTYRNQKMPEPLWQSVLALTKNHPINTIVRALDLDRTCIERRLFKLEPRLRDLSDPHPAIAEPTSDPTFLAIDNPLANTTQAHVELTRSDGATMRIQTPPAHLNALITLFLQGRPHAPAQPCQ